MSLVNKVNYIIGMTLQENNESLFVLHNQLKDLMGPNSSIRYPFSPLLRPPADLLILIYLFVTFLYQFSSQLFIWMLLLGIIAKKNPHIDPMQYGLKFKQQKTFSVFAQPDVNTSGVGRIRDTGDIVMQTRDEVEGFHNCREFSQPLECLYQAMQIQEKSVLFLS